MQSSGRKKCGIAELDDLFGNTLGGCDWSVGGNEVCTKQMAKYVEKKERVIRYNERHDGVEVWYNSLGKYQIQSRQKEQF